MSARVQRKIDLLEAKAASTTFPEEADTCLRLVSKLRDNLPDDDPPDLAIINRALEQAAWAVVDLDAVPASDFGGRSDQWVVPGHGPAVDMVGLIQIWVAQFPSLAAESKAFQATIERA